MKKHFTPSCFSKVLLLYIILFISPTILFSQIDEDLFNSIQNNNYSGVVKAIENGADINAQDENGATVLMWAVFKADDLDITKYLFYQGVDLTKKGIIYQYPKNVNLSNRYYGNALSAAAGEGKLDHLIFLVESGKIDIKEKGFNKKTKKNDGDTALVHACKNLNYNVVEYLLKKGEDKQLALELLLVKSDIPNFKYYNNPQETTKNVLTEIELSLDKIEKKHGKGHPIYIKLLDDKARFYYSLNQKNIREDIYKQQMHLIEKNYGKDNLIYFYKLFFRAMVLNREQEVIKARSYINTALEYKKEKFAIPYRYSLVLISADNYILDNQPQKALQLILDFLKVSDDKTMLDFSGQLVKIYSQLGDTKKAIRLLKYNYQKSFKNLTTPDNKIYDRDCKIINYYADQFKKFELFILSKKIRKQACQCYETILYRNNFYINGSSMFFEMGKIYESLEDYESSYNAYITSISYKAYESIKNYNFIFSADQKKGIGGTEIMSRLLSFVKRHPEFTIHNSEIFERVLYSKGLLFNTWKEIYNISNREFNQNEFNDITNTLNEAQAKLAIDFAHSKNINQNILFSQVKKELKRNEAIVDFFDFQYYEEGKIVDTIYAAFVFTKKSKYPEVVFLCNEKELRLLLKKSNVGKDAINQLYNNRGLVPGKRNKSLAQFYDQLWHPIDSLLSTKIKTVYYSPSGLLNRINFSAIPINKNEILNDKYQLRLLSSSKDILLKKKISRKFKNNKAALYGGLIYEMDSISFTTANKKYNQTVQHFSLSDINIQKRGGVWKYLEFTKEEVLKVEKRLKEKKIQVTIYDGYEGTEESFKLLGQKEKSPEIIHLATHGYFFSKNLPQAENQYLGKIPTLSDHPLFRTGLILAGGNHTWKGLPPISGYEDGILTAYEIAHMDLSNTQLVVLSACETGLGEIQSGEGVQGLQLSFKIAGVDQIIMSLWETPDYHTKELMLYFYDNWLSGEEIHQAFYYAQTKMRQQYKEPYFWAGFVLLE